MTKEAITTNNMTTQSQVKRMNAIRDEIAKMFDYSGFTDDRNLPVLTQAVDYFCSTYDKCEGLKHALLLTMDDQLDNHADEQDVEDFEKILNILR